MPLPAESVSAATAARPSGITWAEHKKTFYLSLVCVVVVILLTIWKLLQKPKKAPTSLSAQSCRFRLVAKTPVNYNTINFRFALPTEKHRLGLPIGKHIVLRKPLEGKEEDQVARNYTPVTSDDELGFFELVIKIYEKPFPGKMGTFLKNLPLQSEVEMCGPRGHLSYLGCGKFEIMRRDTEQNKNLLKSYNIKNVGMIAGGTGLTPMLQIVRDVLKNTSDRTNLCLIFANVREEDIILRIELEALAERHRNFRIYNTLNEPPADWKQGRGFVTAAMIAEQLVGPGPETMVLICGPPPMVKAQEQNLKALKYADDSIFVF